MVRSASNTFDRSGCVELRGHHGASLGLVPLHLDDTLLLSGSNFHAGGVHEGVTFVSGRMRMDVFRAGDSSLSFSIRRQNV